MEEKTRLRVNRKHITSHIEGLPLNGIRQIQISPSILAPIELVLKRYTEQTTKDLKLVDVEAGYYRFGCELNNQTHTHKTLNKKLCDMGRPEQ